MNPQINADERQTIAAMFTDDSGQSLKMLEHKLKLSLVPRKLIENMAKVYEYGLVKYSRDSWRKFTPEQANECLPDAAFRHLLAYLDGEEIDPESGLHHLDQCAWNCQTIRIINSEANK